jgi:hypothetical protein
LPERGAAEWLIEEGIGERRALLVERGQVRAARLCWPGELAAGTQTHGQLVAKLQGTRRGLAQLDDGREALVDHLPQGVSEGASLALVITRAPMAERGRLKRAQARVAGTGPLPSPFPEGRIVRRFPADFPGGEILIGTTAAMSVIDIDGIGAPRSLALAAVPAIARALAWFDLGGNIAIDFPTIAARDDRRAVDAALAVALADWPHERTAMNGFGLVQLVARLEGPSLIHRFAHQRLGMAARMALRRAEIAAEAGGTGRVIELMVHPALEARIVPAWREALARRTGRSLEIRSDPGLAIIAANAQLVGQ